MKTHFLKKRKYFIVYIITGILMLPLAMFAQKISGRVTDRAGNALPAVNIYIPELEKRVMTDACGKFSVHGIGKKIIRIECSHLSYTTIVKNIDPAKQEKELTIVMEPATIPLQEIVVTSNQTQLAKNIPYVINPLYAADLKRSSKVSLLETMANQPGIDIISGGSGIGKPVIRGMSFNRIVMYSQGTKIENQQWDDDHDAGISEAGIDKVEVVYGPSALIYGADALGGAIIFVDEKPAPAGKLLGKAGMTWFSNSRGINVNAGIKSTSRSGFFYIANINDQSHADYLQGKDPATGNSALAVNSRFNNLSGKIKTGISRKWGVSKLTYTYLRSLTGMIVDESDDSAATADGKPFTKSRRLHEPYQEVGVHILSSENTILTGRSKLNINAAWQVNNRKEFEPVPVGQPQYVAMGLLLHTFTYDTKWSSNSEKSFGLSIGTQGMLQTNRNFGNNIGVPDADVNDFAAYSLLRYNSPNEHWNLLGGIRFDIRSIKIFKTNGLREGEASLDSLEQAALLNSTVAHPLSEFSKYYYPISFSAGAAFLPVKNISLKANVATGFSAPNYAELSTFGKHAGTDHFEVGNSDLRTEQNIEGDVNASLDQRDFSLVFSAFYNHVKDYIYLAPTADSVYDLQVIAYKQENAKIYGGELSLDLHPQAARWLDVRSSLSISTGKLPGGYLPYFPSDKMVSECTFSKDSIGRLQHPWFSLIVNKHFSQHHPAMFEENTDGYTLLDTQAGAELKVGKNMINVEIFCTNLFNKAYHNHLSIIKDIPVFEKGRNAGIRIHVPFGG